MVAITEERKNSLERASRSYKEKRGQERQKERERKRGKKKRKEERRESSKGNYHDMVVIAVANEINFHDFSSLCGLHMAVNINRFPPGEFSPRSTAAPIENLRQFRRATVSCSKGGTRARPRERENRAEKWRGKKKKKEKKKEKEGK